MNPTMNAYLATAIKSSQPDDNSVRTGTVFSIDGTTLGVLINGGVVPCGYLSNWVPAVGQTVAMMRQGADWLVLGPMGGPAAVQAQVPFVLANTAYCTTGISIVSPTFVDAGNPTYRYTRTANSSRLVIGAWFTGLFTTGGNQAELALRIETYSGASVVADKVVGVIHGPIASYRFTGGGMNMFDPFDAGEYRLRLVCRRSIGAGNFFRNGDDIGSVFAMEVPT